MKSKYFCLTLLILSALPLNAQIFNFSLRTNNQQLIDEAMAGAFVKINQAYELCDTVQNEHFGRNEKDYFSIVPFIGVETEQGLVFPSAALTPWTYDNDFDEYKGKYKPIVTDTKLSLLNCRDKAVRSISDKLSGTTVSNFLTALSDSTQTTNGLKIDSIAGVKNGWLIWITSESNLADNDSVRLNSIKKEIEVPVDGEFLRIEKPDISGTVYGGIYVTPQQTGIGQIAFTLTGVMVLDDEGWVLDFPFIKEQRETKALTPIDKLGGKGKLNPLKKKK